MKTMTMTVCRRPEYLIEVLDTLKAAKPEGYKLFLGIEPDNQEVRDICKNIDFMETDYFVNDRVLGVRENPFKTQERAFNAGSEFNIYLESDVVVSPDVVRMSEWYRQLPNRDDFLCMNLWCPESEEISEELRRHKRFSALGIAVSKHQWERWFHPTWMTHQNGWDYSFIKLLTDNPELYSLTPKMSRTHHIGRFGGAHYNAPAHDHIYANNKWNQDDRSFDYRITEEISR